MASEYDRHEHVNLDRLFRRLVSSTDGLDETDAIRAKKALQTVQFAKRMLRNVERNKPSDDIRVIESRQAMRSQLDHIQSRIQDRLVVVTSSKPKKQPPSLLLSLPRPQFTPEPSTAEEEEEPATDLLLSPTDPLPAPPPPDLTLTAPDLLLPPTPLPPTKSTITASSQHLHHSHALQEELQAQLAQMATQLKKNAVHFSDALVRDTAAIEKLGTQLEGNLDHMGKERVRLRDHRGKSGSTTCLAVTSVVAVMISFVVMVWIIRFT